MKEVKDFLTLICLILKEQKLQLKLIKHQNKMVDFYINNKEVVYKQRDTKIFWNQLKNRILKIKNELVTK